MHARHVVGFLLLFAWQVAPPAAPRDRLSRLRIWFGGGRSSYDYSYWGTAGGECYDCYCENRTPIRQRLYDAADRTTAYGIRADAWPSPALRVSGAYGSAGPPDVRRPAFAGGLVAWEGRRAGFGGGWASGAARVRYDGLAGYARLGSLDGPQLRADLRAPTETPGATGWARAGFAYNTQGRRDDISVFFGISAVEAGPDTTYGSPESPVGRPSEGETARLTRPAFFLDVTLPLSRSLDVFGRGHVAKQAGGFGFGIALRFGT